jgi:ABC-type sugar transport system ATPase subunit
MLEMHGIGKRFGGVVALEGVDFVLRPGEVHALVGENGAGKSTLMKILSGVQPPSEGQIVLDGRQVSFRGVHEAQAAGIAMVYQELALVPHLSVAENLFLGRLDPWVRHRDLIERAGPLLAEVELDVDPHRSVASLPIGEQQLVEIAKALGRESRVLVLDEPTAALSSQESERLFAILRRLRASGTSLVYISHRLEEVFALADRVTVLRDGRRVATHELSEVDGERIVRDMVGRDVVRFERASTRRDAVRARFGFEGAGLAAGELVLHEGEITGVAGVAGSGRSRLCRTLYGAEGVATLDGARVASPRAALERGLAYVPEDRKGEGLSLVASVQANLAHAILPRLSRAGVMRPGAERANARSWTEQLGIRPPDPQREVATLSGGNQQKVVVGKGLATGPRVLLMDEPTRGVDVGARTELYEVLDDLATRGMALLLASSDTDELIQLCDRILVFRHGAVATTLHAPFDHEEVVAHVTGARAVA